MKPGIKGGEVELTSAQREQLQWLTDDTVIGGLVPILANPLFQQLTDEKKEEVLQKRIIDFRAKARDRFRAQLKRKTD